MKRIAVWTFLVGSYAASAEYYREQLDNFKENYCKGEDVRYVVFTDNPAAFRPLGVRVIPVAKVGSRDAAMRTRFKYLLTHRGEFKQYDYLQYVDSTIRCAQDVTLDWVLGDGEIMVSAISDKLPALKASFKHEKEDIFKVLRRNNVQYYYADNFCGTTDAVFALAERIEELRRQDEKKGLRGGRMDVTYFNQIFLEGSLPYKVTEHTYTEATGTSEGCGSCGKRTSSSPPKFKTALKPVPFYR